jgi:hypothetical protein
MDTVICYECGTKIVPSRGRPDIFVLNPTAPTYVCEVKVLLAGETSLPFNKVTEKQRLWLDRWANDGGRGFIGLGVIRKHGKVDRLEHLYLIPWEAWLRAESLIRPFQASIPLEAGPGYSRELQEAGMDILHLFQRFEMIRESGHWQLPTCLEGRIEYDRTNDDAAGDEAKNRA